MSAHGAIQLVFSLCFSAVKWKFMHILRTNMYASAWKNAGLRYSHVRPVRERYWQAVESQLLFCGIHCTFLRSSCFSSLLSCKTWNEDWNGGVRNFSIHPRFCSAEVECSLGWTWEIPAPRMGYPLQFFMKWIYGLTLPTVMLVITSQYNN